MFETRGPKQVQKVKKPETEAGGHVSLKPKSKTRPHHSEKRCVTMKSLPIFVGVPETSNETSIGKIGSHSPKSRRCKQTKTHEGTFHMQMCGARYRTHRCANSRSWGLQLHGAKQDRDRIRRRLSHFRPSRVARRRLLPARANKT